MSVPFHSASWRAQPRARRRADFAELPHLLPLLDLLRERMPDAFQGVLFEMVKVPC